jgi:hypothetical protein
MLTAGQRKELEAILVEMKKVEQLHWTWRFATHWADRIAAVLADGVEAPK